MKLKKLTQELVGIILILFILVGCGTPTTPSPTLVPPAATSSPPSETPIAASPTTQISTATPAPTVTVRVVPTPTSTEVNWSSLPSLVSVALTEQDIFLVSSYLFGESYFRENFLERHETTNELQETCLLDCAKVRMTFKSESLSISLMRADSAQKAQQTARQLHDDFLAASGTEYSLDDFGGIGKLPSNTWLIGRDRGTLRDAVLGYSRGPVILLLVWTYDLLALGICEVVDESLNCEGDLSGLSLEALGFAELQFDRLTEAGYPP